MKAGFSFVTLMALLITPSFAPPALAQAGGNAALEATLMENERKVSDAVKNGDLATFSSMVAQDGWSVDVAGPAPVSEFVKVFTQLKITEQALSDMKVMWVGSDVAIVVYKWTGKGTFNGQAVPGSVTASTVWANRGGKWTAVFHQETPLMGM